MPRLSVSSLKKLEICHPDIRRLLQEAIKHVDFTILEGHRDRKTQDEHYRQGRSKLKYPNSKHNSLPSEAVDIAPYPIDWNDRNRFIRVASFIQGLAVGMGIKIRWGGDWNGDFLFNESFVDMPHLEIGEYSREGA